MSVVNFDRDLTLAGNLSVDVLSSVTSHAVADFPKVVTDGTVKDSYGAIFRSGLNAVQVTSTQAIAHGIHLKKPNDGEGVLYRVKGFSFGDRSNFIHSLFFGIVQEAPSNIAGGQVCAPYHIVKMSEGSLSFDETIRIPWHDDILGTDMSSRQLTIGVATFNDDAANLWLRWNYHLSVQALDQRPPDYVSEMR